jgi:hypothetical protein
LNTKLLFRMGFCCLILAGIFIPLAGALSENTPNLNTRISYLARDSPDIIATLKDHTVFLAGSQQARMDGIIRYVGRLSNDSAVSDLQWIEEDYLTAASSIPMMYSSDEINLARKDMQEQSVRFSDETGIRLAMLGGNYDTMMAYVNDSMQALNSSLSDKNSTPWLTSGRARLKVFLNSSEERNATLADLSRQGVDISQALEISENIDAEQLALQDALAHRGDDTIRIVNGRIRILNQNFRSTVLQYRTDLDIRMKAAALLAMK